MTFSKTSEIRQVLLQGSGWHDVEEGSFGLDPHEFFTQQLCPHDTEEFKGYCTRGFTFIDLEYSEGRDSVVVSRMVGPLTSIIAIRAQGRGKEVTGEVEGLGHEV